MNLLGRLARVLRRGGAAAGPTGPVAGGASAAAAAPAPGVGVERLPYRGDLAGCRYVSENSLAALSGESVEALHRLELLDGEGQRLQVVETRSRRPYVCLEPAAGGPADGGPAAQWARLTLAVDPERLGPEAAALLRQLPSPGRACLQVRLEEGGPWRALPP